ncbi:MAG: hypothetical protein U0O42_04205, partial [Oscillospiraceae bacterium]
FWVVAASVAVCVVVAVCFLTNPPTDTDAAGLVGFHREQVTYADVTDESGAQPSNVQLTAEETDAVYALLDTLQYKRLGAASAMQDCYARLYFISAAGERCEIMLSEREMLVNPITDGKTARLYELHSGSAELRDYLFGCIGASEPAEEEMKTMTEPTLSLTLTVPAAWEDIAELSACDKGTTYLGYGIMLFHLSEKNALAAYPDGGMGNVWWLVAMSWDNFKEWRGYDALPVPEILGIAEYVLGADDEYVYLLVLPSDVQFLLNDPVSQRQYEALQSDSQGVLTRFLKDNGIHINDMCPASSVFSPPARGGAAITTGYAAYDALLAEISGLRRSGASEVQTDFSHDLLSVNDYYQTPGWLLRDLDGDGIPELLLGADWGDGHTVIFNIYCLDGAKAVRVVDGWSRSRWYLCTDGSLAHEGSDGASEGTYSYYRYENGALRHLETVISLDGWLYSDTTDHYVGGKGFRPVSEDEANAVREKYTHETLSFTPFVV